MIEEKSRVPNQKPRFELIDKDGVRVASYTKVSELGEHASIFLKSQEQDEERSGRGWDIAVVGADR